MQDYAWWKQWGGFIKKLFAQLASFASILSLLFFFAPDVKALPIWVIILVFAAIVSCTILVAIEYNESRSRRVFNINDKNGIRDYMHNWIVHGDRVAIWTRDMSWANNKETEDLLCDKATKKELIICMPVASELANKLKKSGAELYCYGNEIDAPNSRFTIAFFERDGSRVAVGRTDGAAHVIEEFDSGDHPAYYLAKDLVSLVRNHSVRSG